MVQAWEKSHVTDVAADVMCAFWYYSLWVLDLSCLSEPLGGLGWVSRLFVNASLKGSSHTHQGDPIWCFMMSHALLHQTEV
jgi:hypothetical protein